jgi:hypothetical protein
VPEKKSQLDYYLQQAKYARGMAEAATTNPEIRQQWLAIAREYETLAKKAAEIPRDDPS